MTATRRLDWREEFVALGLAESESDALDMFGEPLPPEDDEPTMAEVALRVAEELEEEMVADGRIRSVHDLLALRSATVGVVADAADRDLDLAERRERAQLWRDALPGLAEEMLAGGGPDERWSEEEILSVGDELGIDLDSIDTTGISEHGVAEAAWLATAIKRKGQLHRDLNVPENQPIPHAEIVAAASRPGKVGQRARLALRLIAMSRRRTRRAVSGGAHAMPYPRG